MLNQQKGDNMLSRQQLYEEWVAHKAIRFGAMYKVITDSDMPSRLQVGLLDYMEETGASLEEWNTLEYPVCAPLRDITDCDRLLKILEESDKRMGELEKLMEEAE